MQQLALKKGTRTVKLEELFAGVLDVPVASISDKTSPATNESWTSIAHMNLIVAMEEMYGITFATAEIRSIKSFADARTLLGQKGIMWPE